MIASQKALQSQRSLSNCCSSAQASPHLGEHPLIPQAPSEGSLALPKGCMHSPFQDSGSKNHTWYVFWYPGPQMGTTWTLWACISEWSGSDFAGSYTILLALSLRVQSTQRWSIYGFCIRNRTYSLGIYFRLGYLDPLPVLPSPANSAGTM